MSPTMIANGKWLALLCLLSTAMLEPVFAQGCAFADGAAPVNYTVNFGTITVQRDTAVGTVLATQTTPINNLKIGSCENPYSAARLMQYAGAISLGDHIYSTNLPGIGIRAYILNRYAEKPQNFISSYENAGIYTFTDNARVEIIKVGNVTPGVLNRGLIGSTQLTPRSPGPYIDAYNVYMGTALIRVAACTVKQTNIIVPLGKHLKQELTGIGSTTINQPFSIPLSCNVGAKIHMRLDATADASNVPGVIALSPNQANANGVGIQVLLENGATQPVVLGKVVDFIQPVAVDGDYNINMQARYYQTKSIVTAGVANAIATFTMIYQ